MNEPYAAQCAAIKHRDGPAIVIAGPGSGKTFVLVKRLENLINNCQTEPSSILTITYTNAAADEMRRRAYTLLGSRAYAAGFGTFHSVFYGILKHSFSLNASNILKPRDKYMILSDIAVRMKLDTADMRTLADELAGMISRKKNGLSSKTGADEAENEAVFSLYQERLKELRLIDFDDMILKCRSLFEKDPAVLKRWQERYRYIQIDEFQDINPIQYETAMLLAGNDVNVLAAGDDDQAIYGFRGAAPDIMQGFIKDHEGLSLYELQMNFRCSKPIAEAADKVIAENTLRIEKHHEAFNETGNDVDIRCFADREREISAMASEIEASGAADCAVLTRTNEFAAYFEEELERCGIPVKKSGKRKSIYESDTAKDVIAYMRLASGAYLREDILRVINKPMRYISREAFANDGAKPEDACAYYRGRGASFDNAVRFVNDIKMMGGMHPKSAMRYLMKVVGYGRIHKGDSIALNRLGLLSTESGKYSSIKQWLKAIEDTKDAGASFEDVSDGVSVLTLHASKGLEFKEVFIADVNEGVIPYHKAVLKEEIEEERRLFYVGMTRAIKKLHLFYIEDSFGKHMPPSRFLSSLEVKEQSHH